MSRAKVEKTEKGYKFFGSVFGGCMHSQELSLMGVRGKAPDADLQAIFQAGHVSEEETKQDLAAAGFKLHFASSDIKNQHSVFIAKQYEEYEIILACHLDGMLLQVGDWEEAGYWKWPTTNETEIYLFEHKSVKADCFDKFIKDPENYFLANYEPYKWQVSAQYWGLLDQLFAEARELPENINIEDIVLYAEIFDQLQIMISVHDRDTILPRRLAFLLDKVPYSKAECLDRCNQIVRNYKDEKVSKCDSKWQCDYLTNSVSYNKLPVIQSLPRVSNRTEAQKENSLAGLKLPKRKA